MTHDTARTITYGITALALAVIIGFRLRGMRKSTPLKLERLWIVPTLYTLCAVGLFWTLPPKGSQWLWAAGALILGGGVGWLRGKAMRITVDPETHDLNQRQSPAALIIILVLVAARFYARSAFGMDGDMSHVSHGIIDSFVAFAVGLLALQRIEMFLRARRLLEAARTG